jgi:hypothetical protein
LSTAEETLGTSVAAGFIESFFPNLSYSDRTKLADDTAIDTEKKVGLLNSNETIKNYVRKAELKDQLAVAMLAANHIQVQVEAATATYNEQLKLLRQSDLGRAGVESAVEKLKTTFSGIASDPGAAPEPGRLLESIMELEVVLGQTEATHPLKKEAAAAVPLLRATLVSYRTAYPLMIAATGRMAGIVAQGDRVFTMRRRIARNPIVARNVTLKLEVSVDDADGTPSTTYSTIAQEKISMGYQVMTVSAGLAGSSMKKTQYTAVTSTTRDSNGEDKTTNQIGTESNSARLLPMIQLNADLWDFGLAKFPVSLNASLGMTGKVDNQGTDIEFLVGPSLGLLGNNLYVTVGAYGGRQQVLQSGLDIGSEIPSSTVPVGKSLKWGFGWSLTWKFK